MKISAFPPGYKPIFRFARPDKTDTHFVLTTAKYIVDIVYHSSVFYSPDFFCVAVKGIAGNEIWNGGKAIFLDSLFAANFISDEFDRMILTRVNSTESSSHCQIILVDLKTGKEVVITQEGAYYLAGNFASFDGVFYATSKNVHCIDYSSNTKFLLHDILRKCFAGVKAWGICAVKDCILVVSGDSENNVSLFNIHKQEVVKQVTLPLKAADSVSINIEHVTQADAVTLSVSYSHKQQNGGLLHTATEYFKIEF